jgi:hypothetical protein
LEKLKCLILFVIMGAETDFQIFVWGGMDKYLGGCCCLLWPGRGGNARKGQGKSLTKFVF